MVKKGNLNIINLSFNFYLLFLFWISFFFIFLFLHFHLLFFYFYTHFFFISQTFPYLILLLLLFIRTQWFQFFKLHLWRNKFLLHFIPKQLFIVALLLFFLVLPFDIFNIILIRQVLYLLYFFFGYVHALLIGVPLSLRLGRDLWCDLEFISEVWSFVFFDFSFVLADVFLNADFFFLFSRLRLALELGTFFWLWNGVSVKGFGNKCY